MTFVEYCEGRDALQLIVDCNIDEAAKHISNGDKTLALMCLGLASSASYTLHRLTHTYSPVEDLAPTPGRTTTMEATCAGEE